MAELIVTGTERTRREVQRTVADMRDAMGLTAAFTEFQRRAGGSPAPNASDQRDVDQHR